MKKLLRAFVTSLAALSATTISAAPRAIFSKATEVDPSLSISTASSLIKNRKLCGADSVMLAPDGSAFGIWSANNRYAYGNRKILSAFPDHVRVVSLLEDKANTLVSPLVLDPIGWDPNSNALQVAMAGELVLSLSTSNDRLVGFKVGSQSFRFARLNSNKLLFSEEILDQLQTLETFASAGKSPSDRLFIFLGQKPMGLHWDTSTPSAKFSDVKIGLNNPADLFAFKDVELSVEGEEWQLVGYGKNEHSLDLEVPYLSSIFDRKIGKRAALFSPKSVFDVSSNGLKRSFSASDDEVIVDVDLVGSRYAIFLQGLDGSQRLLHGPIDALQEFKTCDPKYRLFATPQRFGDVSTGKFTADIGDATNSISYVLRKSFKRQSKVLTVVFHGGPLASTLAPSLPSDAQTQELPCSDVLTIDGAGSVGGGLENSSRISQQGFSAFSLDAKTVQELTNGMGYDEVHVIGNSFGGISGVAATKIDWPELRSVSLVAPALQMLPPERRSSKEIGDFSTSRVGLEALNSFGDYVFGENRDDVNMGMAYFLSDPDPRAHVYLGTADQGVPFELMPKDFPANQLTVIPGATHSSMFRHGKVLTSVADRICGSGKSDLDIK